MSDNSYKKVVAKNRRASFDYSIEENIEAGIMLTGSELKSIREGKVSLADSHAAEGSGELYLYNCHIVHRDIRPQNLMLDYDTNHIKLIDFGCAITYGIERSGDIPHSLASIDKAKNILGYNPSHNLQSGLKEAVDWYWKNLNGK